MCQQSTLKQLGLVVSAVVVKYSLLLWYHCVCTAVFYLGCHGYSWLVSFKISVVSANQPVLRVVLVFCAEKQSYVNHLGAS